MRINALPATPYLGACFSVVDGDLYWKHRPDSHFPQKGCRPSSQIAKMWNAKHSGNRAGRVMQGKTPYRQVGIDGKRFLEHRVVAAMSGLSITQVVDHIDGNGLNNNPTNLRSASQQQNSMNNAGWKSRDSYPGVYRRDRISGKSKWIALIRIQGKNKSVGTFDSYEKAVLARISAEEIYRGGFSYSASRLNKDVAA